MPTDTTIMNLTLWILSFGLAPAAARPVPEDVAAITLLPLNPVILGRNPHYALSKRAGQRGREKRQSPPPANLAPTNPEPTIRQPYKRQTSTIEPSKSEGSTSEPTGPQINWSDDWGTNHVRRWPFLFLPRESKDKDWETHVCEAVRLKHPGCKSANANILLEAKGLARHARPGPPYTVVTNMKPLIRISIAKPSKKGKNVKPSIREHSELYISRDGRTRLTPPEALPPPEDEHEYRQSRQKAFQKLQDLARIEIDRHRTRTWDVRRIMDARQQLQNWEQSEDMLQRERDIWWAQQRWREDS